MFLDDAFPSSSPANPSEFFPEPNHLLSDDNNLDDVWGSDDASTPPDTSPGEVNHYLRNEPSEIPRLRSQHSTSGYRDGIAVAKGTTIQEGFDEGYGLGAVMGLEVGTILGTLEGISAAMGKQGSEQEAEARRMRSLLEKARMDLKTEEVFGREWWGSDGIWKYSVAGEGKEDIEDFTFKEVVQAHPLVKKWRVLVLQEVEKWKLDLSAREHPDEDR